MKIKIDPIALEFVSTVLNVGKKISPEAVLYWSRNEDKLKQILQIQNFEPISPASSHSFFIPSLAETNRQDLFKKGIMERKYSNEFWDNIEQEQKATTETNVYPSHLNVGLKLEELFEETGYEDLKRSALTYSQIEFLCSKHSGPKSKKQAVLSYHEPTYIPFVKSNGEMTFIVLQSRHEFVVKQIWRAWFWPVKEFKEGNLIVKEDVIKLF